MLQALSIRDFAIIDAVEFDLRAGLTVVTGETGAGKSILVNALNLVLGGRARADVVRTGADSARVEALFDLSAAPAARARLETVGIEAGEELVVRRVVERNGRHRVYLNGTLATVKMLGEVTGGLVDISGQHEHYSLLRTDFHLELLDRTGGLGALRDQVTTAYGRVAALDARMDELRARQRDRAEREAFLSFQLVELDEAALDQADEEERLEVEAVRLRNTEKLREAARAAEADLYADDGAARASRSVKVRAMWPASQTQPAPPMVVAQQHRSQSRAELRRQPLHFLQAPASRRESAQQRRQQVRPLPAPAPLAAWVTDFPEIARPGRRSAKRRHLRCCFLVLVPE